MRQNKRDDEGEPEEEDGAMKICGACGLGLDRSCFSNKQWQQSMQKRRCRECVDKSTSPGEGQAGHGTSEAESGHGGDDVNLNEEPQPSPVEGASVNDDVQCTGASSEGQPAEPRSPVPEQIADDAGRAGETAEGGTDGDEICSICLDVFDNPVQLPCDHSFCEVCLDGWHKTSKFDVHQPRNCPVCRHRVKPSREIISKLHMYSVMVSASEGGEDFDEWKKSQEDLLADLFKNGHTEEEIDTMLQEYRDSQFQNTKSSARLHFGGIKRR